VSAFDDAEELPMSSDTVDTNMSSGDVSDGDSVGRGMTEVASAPALMSLSDDVAATLNDLSLTAVTDDDELSLVSDKPRQTDNDFYFYQGELAALPATQSRFSEPCVVVLRSLE